MAGWCWRDLLSGWTKLKEPSFIYGTTCSEEVQRAIWAKYVAYRESRCIIPFHMRKSTYKVRLFRLGAHVVKEYTGARQAVLAEIAIMHQIHHSNLLSFVAAVDEGHRINVIMDWAGDCLREHRSLLYPQHYSEELVRLIMYQMTHALTYLHHKNIIHRDIKPDNIAIQSDLSVQLFDWNEALNLDDLKSLSDKQLARQVGLAGTPFFMPPEVLNYLTGREARKSAGGLRSYGGCRSSGGCLNAVETASTSGGCRSSGDSLNKPGAAAVDQQLSARQQRLAARQQRYALLRKIISPKLDIWGLGTVLYFLLADRDIFIHENGWELENLADVTSASYGVQLPPDIAASAGARDFLQRCLERNPDMRATAKELLLHPWLRGSPLPEAEEVPEQQQQQPERKHHSKSSIDLPWMPQPGSPPLIAIRAFSPSTPESPSTSE